MKNKLLSILFLSILSLSFSACKKDSKQAKQASMHEQLTTAQDFLKEGDPETSILILEELNKSFPNSPEVLESLAFAYAQQKDHLEAAFYFEQAANFDQEHTNLLLYAASSYSEEKNWHSAEMCYVRYLQAYPQDGQAWKLLAKTYSSQNLPDEALGAYMNALNEDRGIPNPLESITIGKLYAQKKDYAQANDWFEIGLHQPESRPFALLGQAEIYIKFNKYSEAMDKLLTLETEFPSFNELNNVQTLKKHLNTHFKSAFENTNQSSVILAAVPSDDNDIEDLSEEIATPQDLSNHDAETLIAESIGAPLSVTDNEPTTQNRANQNNTNTLAQNVSAALSSQPQNWVQIAEDAKLAKNYPEAINAYWKAIQSDSQNSELWSKISNTYLLDRSYQDAKKTALEAVRLAPTSEKATLTYLKTLKALPAQDILFQELSKAEEKFPQSTDIALFYANCFIEKQANYPYATMVYVNFLKRNPGHPEANKIQTEIQAIQSRMFPKQAKTINKK